MDDDVSAIVGGLLGTAAITALLVVFDALAPITIDPFGEIAGFIGTPGNHVLGMAIFFALGTFVWSFLFATLGRFLPGESDVARGIAFSIVLWIGFAVAFPPGTTLVNLALFFGFTLAVHVVYGVTLGAIYGRVADHDMQEV